MCGASLSLGAMASPTPSNSATRASNSATVAALARVLRGYSAESPDLNKVMVADIEDQVDELKDLILDLLRYTARPTKVTLTKASMSAWPIPLQKAELFASRIVASVSYCRRKGKTSTNGKKLHRSTFEIYTRLCQLSDRSPSSSRKSVGSVKEVEKEDDRSMPRSSSFSGDKSMPRSSSFACTISDDLDVQPTRVGVPPSSMDLSLSPLRRLYGMDKAEEEAHVSPQVIGIFSSQEVLSSQDGPADTCAPPVEDTKFVHFLTSIVAPSFV